MASLQDDSPEGTTDGLHVKIDVLGSYPITHFYNQNIIPKFKKTSIMILSY